MSKEKNLLLLLFTAIFTMNSLAKDNDTQEQLYGIQFNKNSMNINVKSTGCTKPAHFTIKTQAHKERTQLEIIRHKADRCRAMPKVISIQLELPKDSKPPFHLVNTFTPSQKGKATD